MAFTCCCLCLNVDIDTRAAWRLDKAAYAGVIELISTMKHHASAIPA
jgi:hypothetical protein